MKLITQTHLVPSLKMRPAILLLPFYVFMVWTGQLYLYIYGIKQDNFTFIFMALNRITLPLYLWH